MILWRFVVGPLGVWQSVILVIFGILVALQEFWQKSRMVPHWSWHWLGYWFWLIPEMIYWGIPLASLVATIMVWQGLTRHREILGLWCVGVSSRHLLGLVAVMGFFNGLILGLLDGWVLNRSYVKRHQIYFEKLRKTPALLGVGSQTNRFYFRLEPYVFFLERLETGWRLQIWLWDDATGQISQVLWSDRVQYDQGVLHIQEGRMLLVDPQTGNPLWQDNIERTWSLPSDVLQVITAPRTLNVLNWQQLLDFSLRGQALGVNVAHFWADFWHRLSYFLSPVTLMILATWLSLSASLDRNASLWGLGGVIAVITVVFLGLLNFLKTWSLRLPNLAPLTLFIPHGVIWLLAAIVVSQRFRSLRSSK